MSTYHRRFQPAGYDYVASTGVMEHYLEILEQILPECNDIQKLPRAQFKPIKLSPPGDELAAKRMKGLSVFGFRGGVENYAEYTVYLVFRKGLHPELADAPALLACFGDSYVDLNEAIGLPSVQLSEMRQFQIMRILADLACNAFTDTQAMANLGLADWLSY